MDKVSILMPVRNAAPFLKECIHSILCQSYPNWELIAVDDHSEDQSIDIFTLFKDDPRIHLSGNKGRGIIPALQQALKASTGKYITRMDADDLMTPLRLEKMVHALKLADHNTIVTGLVKYFSDQPISEGYLKYESWLNEINLTGTQWENIYRECVIASPNWMTHRETLDQIGGFSSLIYPEDYHMVLKWYHQKIKFKAIPETTLLWREHPDRTSRSDSNYSQSAFFKLKIKSFIAYDLRSDNLVIWGKNEKVKLTSQILKESHIPFYHFDINGFQSIEKLPKAQLLVGVYPDNNERIKIEKYLMGISMNRGRDWWYI